MSCEWNFTCYCGKSITIEVPTAEAAQDRQIMAAAVGEKGWVLTEPTRDQEGKVGGARRRRRSRTDSSFRAVCTVECHNHRVAYDHGDPRWRLRWWTKVHHFDGEPPPCVCRWEPREDGLLVERRDKSCPWHLWHQGWRAAHNDLERRRFQYWKTVSVGTVVARGGERGRTTGPARLNKARFGGFDCVVIDVDGLSPPVWCEDLILVEPMS